MITNEELEMMMIEIVAFSGDARTKLLSAVKEAKEGNLDRTHALINEAQELSKKGRPLASPSQPRPQGLPCMHQKARWRSPQNWRIP